MKERPKASVSAVLSVDAFHSVYHFSLAGRESRGELHDFYEAVYVESGLYHVLLDGESHIVPPGSVVFFAPNTFHSGDGVTKSNATVYILSFDADSPVMRHFDNRSFPLDAEQRREFLAIFDCAEAAFVHCKGGGITVRPEVAPLTLQRLKNRFELFLLELYGEGDELPIPSGHRQYRKERFRQISDFMKEHLSQRLTVEAIAVGCSIGVTSLKELCREFCGCGPIDYLISLRILAAKELIRDSTLNFTQIAEQTGFGSLHYFSRVFKERTGITPSEYAKMP